MAMIKYSIGGPITSVEDKDGIEKREEAPNNCIAEQAGYIVVCDKCGIQHMLLKGEDRSCCGKTLQVN